jgi:hypothetical protein
VCVSGIECVGGYGEEAEGDCADDFEGLEGLHGDGDGPSWPDSGEFTTQRTGARPVGHRSVERQPWGKRDAC